jgi:acetolactate synthase-1/2/3 large subunit
VARSPRSRQQTKPEDPPRAIAQSEVTGCPGACLTTLGPGVASVVNGVACGLLERAPLIVFTDTYASTADFPHQRLDHRALLEPVTKWSATISAESADEVIVDALARAMAHPRGPVHIDCPGDVLAQPRRSRGSQPSEGGDPERVALQDTLPHTISTARKPLVIAGLGARDTASAAAIRDLCATRRIPAMVTYKAKGVVPDDDPHFAGVFTNGVIERAIVEEADAIVAVGLDDVELLPRPWSYTQPVIRVSTADLVALRDRMSESTWDMDGVRRHAALQREAVCVTTDGLAPHRVVQIVARAAGSARVTVDAGAHMFPATLLWPVREPNGMLISNGLSTMGFALPAAIGAALLPGGPAEAGRHDDGPADRLRQRYGGQEAGRQERDHVVALTGDGGLLMCAGELVTAVREHLPIVVVVFNDTSLSLIDIKQQQRKLKESGVSLGDVNWSALAASVGMAAHAAATERELEDAVSRALDHDGPTLIDARVDPGGYASILKAVRG